MFNKKFISIKGFVIEIDTVFKAILCKQQKKYDIYLEIKYLIKYQQETLGM